jgi:hypothetical protein
VSDSCRSASWAGAPALLGCACISKMWAASFRPTTLNESEVLAEPPDYLRLAEHNIITVGRESCLWSPPPCQLNRRPNELRFVHRYIRHCPTVVCVQLEQLSEILTPARATRQTRGPVFFVTRWRSLLLKLKLQGQRRSMPNLSGPNYTQEHANPQYLWPRTMVAIE